MLQKVFIHFILEEGKAGGRGKTGEGKGERREGRGRRVMMYAEVNIFQAPVLIAKIGAWKGTVAKLNQPLFLELYP